MPQPPKPITLPAVKLTPGPDDDLIQWLDDMRRDNVNVSARIRQALRVYIAGDTYEDYLKRIETALKSLQAGDPQPPLDDPILGGL